jgi:glycosyltransferase involved in cell wall biosynthesis
MLIGIDARFYGSIGKGLGRYTQKLIEHLEDIDHENRYVVFLRKENFDEYCPQNRNFKKELANYRWYSFSEQIFYPFNLRRYKLDVMHFPHFNVPLLYRRKFVITIHDLILIHFPTVRNSTLSPLFYKIKFLAYKIIIKSAIKRAKNVIAVSEFTKRDILETYKDIPEKKIGVTYEACDDYCMVSLESETQILQKYGIMKPYIIYIGNVYPHKNPERLVLASKRMNKSEKSIGVVFVGGDDYFYRRLKKFAADNAADDLVFAGFVPDRDLDTLLRGSLAYIRPSLYEGFELPPLEAMTKGVPVLSSTHSCALEILENSALYFDGDSVDEIVRAIETIRSDADLRQDLICKGYQQIKKYSWKKMAQETLSIYEKAFGKPKVDA